jgi:hypothetical protein
LPNSRRSCGAGGEGRSGADRTGWTRREAPSRSGIRRTRGGASCRCCSQIASFRTRSGGTSTWTSGRRDAAFEEIVGTCQVVEGSGVPRAHPPGGWPLHGPLRAHETVESHYKRPALLQPLCGEPKKPPCPTSYRLRASAIISADPFGPTTKSEAFLAVAGQSTAHKSNHRALSEKSTMLDPSSSRDPLPIRFTGQRRPLSRHPARSRIVES